MKEKLKSIIFDQQEIKWQSKFVERSIPKTYLSSQEIMVVSGIRRCGKSTLLHQIRRIMPEKNYYLNFDDDRLIDFSIDNLQMLYETFIELFGLQKTFYFDEIQNVKGWELFVSRLYENGNKVFVTGSNAALLSRELGTHLTGRYMQLELYPFSFREYLAFNSKIIDEKDFYTTTGRSTIKTAFNTYFSLGGFPQFLRNKQDEYLKALYESIIYRDVMVRNKLTSEKEILELVYFLASNVSRYASYNKLAQTIGIKNPTTVKNYIDFISDSYLLFQINKFDYSVNKQILNPKKIYFIDIALVKKLGFQFSEENGRFLENLVFLELKRRGLNCWYHSGKYECDFVIKEGNSITQAIQVCYSFENNQTKNREVRGLQEALKVYNLELGLILTADYEEDLEFDEGGMIKIRPVWKWLLENEKK